MRQPGVLDQKKVQGRLEADGIASELERAHHTFASRRGIFVTRRGLFGLGSPGMWEGDEIVIISGARTPYIIRLTELEGQYRVVGGCFILHHMHGEIFDGLYDLSGID